MVSFSKKCIPIYMFFLHPFPISYCIGGFITGRERSGCKYQGWLIFVNICLCRKLFRCAPSFFFLFLTSLSQPRNAVRIREAFKCYFEYLLNYMQNIDINYVTSMQLVTITSCCLTRPHFAPTMKVENMRGREFFQNFRLYLWKIIENYRMGISQKFHCFGDNLVIQLPSSTILVLWSRVCFGGNKADNRFNVIFLESIWQ